jgi:cytochrome P450
MSKVLHSDEVVSNVFLFMIAGYETTSTALAYCTYVLATRPDIQYKLVKEIDQNKWNNNNDEDTYETATNLPYLDLFIREILRMYPMTSKAQTRECNITTNVCGHIIEKGLFNIKTIIKSSIFCCRQCHSTGYI